MDALRKNLLTFGYVREYCKLQNISLLPDDILELFVRWLLFGDHFDENKAHPGIQLEWTENGVQKISLKAPEPENYEYYGAVGHLIIGKGEKYSWKFQMQHSTPRIQIGIIDDAILNLYQNEAVCDITDTKWSGWGIYLLNTSKYHNDVDDGFFYLKWNYRLEDEYNLILTLDLTQNDGILSIDFEAEKAEKAVEAAQSKEDSYLYSNLDVNKKYRMAVAFQRTTDDTMKLLCDHYS